MKKIIIIASLIASAVAYGQNIDWGILQTGKGRVRDLIPMENKTFYTTRYLGTLTRSLNLSFHRDLDMATFEKINVKVPTGTATVEDVLKLGSNLVVFLSDKDDGSNILYYQIYSTDCLPVNEPVEVLRYQVPKGYRSSGGYSLTPSVNGQFLALNYSIPGKKDEPDKFGYKIMDTDFKEISEGEYVAEYNTQEFGVSGRFLSDKGEYFLLCKVYNKNSRGKVRDYTSLEKTVIARAAGGTMEVMEIELRDAKSVTDMSFFQDEQGGIRIVGMYGSRGQYTAGIFYMQVDFDSKTVVNQSYNEFSKDFITEGMSERQKKRADKAEANGRGAPQLSQFDFSRSYINEDGSIVGIMEQFYVVVVTTTDSRGMVRSTYYYYYNDLVVYKINAQGEFVFTTKVRKKQASVNDGGYYSSFASYVQGQDLHILFNDNMKNYSENSGEFLDPATSRELETAKYTKKSNVVAEAVVSLETGESTRKIAFKREETEAYAVPKKFSDDPQSNSMIMLLQLGKKEKFGILTY